MGGDLTDLDGVGPALADRLPVDSMSELAKASPSDIAVSGVSESRAENFIQEAREQAVVLQTGDEVRDEYQRKDTIPSGVDALDEMTGGGWTDGDVVLFSGPPGSGKTQLVFQSLATAAVKRPDRYAVYIETERNRFRPDRIDNIAGQDVQDNIIRAKAYGLDKQKSALGKIRNKFSPSEISVVAVDSFTARFRLSDRFTGRESLQERSKVMGRHLERLESLVEDLEAPALLTGQVYGNPSQYGGSASPYGGTVFQHTVQYLMMFEEASGDAKRIKMVNHPGRGDMEGEFHITGTGFKRA